VPIDYLVKKVKVKKMNSQFNEEKAEDTAKIIDVDKCDYLSVEDAFIATDLDDEILDALINGWKYSAAEISEIKLGHKTLFENYAINIRELNKYRMKEIFKPLIQKKKLIDLEIKQVDELPASAACTLCLKVYKHGIEKFIAVTSDFNEKQDKYYPLNYSELLQIVIDITREFKADIEERKNK